MMYSLKSFSVCVARGIGLVLVLGFGLSGCAALPGQETLQLSVESARRGEWVQSIATSSQALSEAEDPEIFFQAYSSRCEFKMWQGDFATAMDDCNDAIRAKQDYYGYPHAARGRLFAMQGLYAWAIEELNIALRMGGTKKFAGSNNPQVIAYGAKARIFATSTDPKFRDTDLALKFAKMAVDLESHLMTPAYKILNRDTLAAAYAQAGQFDAAVTEQRKTIALVQENDWQGMTYNQQPFLRILERHLQTFEQQKTLSDGIY